MIEMRHGLLESDNLLCKALEKIYDSSNIEKIINEDSIWEYLIINIACRSRTSSSIKDPRRRSKVHQSGKVEYSSFSN
jgi:hypothetical protein